MLTAVKTIGTDGTVKFTGVEVSQIIAGLEEGASRSMGMGYNDEATGPENTFLTLYAENRTPENVQAVEDAINGV